MSQAGWVPAMGAVPGGVDPTDVIGRRAAAKVIDALVAGIIGSLGLLMLLRSFHTLTVTDAVAYCERVQTARHGCVSVGDRTVWVFHQPSPLTYLPALVWWFVMTWLEGHFGWTPGKLAVGLRVMRSKTGQVCGFTPSVVRNLMWIVDGFCFGIVGLYLAVRSPGHRRLGDQAAGTLVVDKVAMGTVPTIPGLLPDRLASGSEVLPPDSPIWDHARNTYILWDSAHQVWLEWNAPGNRWEAIST